MLTGLIDPHPAKAVTGHAALAKAECDEPALAREHLGGQLAAVLRGHDPLDALDDGGDRAPVVAELLGAVLELDAFAHALLFEVRGLVRVLKSSPSADVVDQDGLELGMPVRHIGDELLHAGAPDDLEAALSGVDVGLNNFHAVRIGIALDRDELVLGRILLVLGGHAHVGRHGRETTRIIHGLGVGGGRWRSLAVLLTHGCSSDLGSRSLNGS